jgi:4-amino-4-deoxy-L-arabinose transferase-like glycosyltransferase
MLLLSARGRWRLLAAGSLASGLGALVKGPPAWGALAAAWLGLLVMGRRREVSPGRWLLVAAGALAPFAVFLAYDRLALGGAWWDGYVLGQVAASAMGATRDGHTERLYLVREVLGRFPHGLPFVVVALLGALGRQRRAELRARLALLGWAGVVVGGYSAAARAWPWYLLPAYPALGLVAGAGLDDLLSRVRGGLGFRWAQRVVGVAALALLGALPACTPLTGRLPLGIAPCEFGDLPGRARELARERMALLAANVWASSKNQVFVLAEHTGLDVVGLSDAEALARRDDLWVALVRQDITPVPAGWTVVATYGRWALASRARRPRDPAPLPE